MSRQIKADVLDIELEKPVPNFISSYSIILSCGDQFSNI